MPKGFHHERNSLRIVCNDFRFKYKEYDGFYVRFNYDLFRLNSKCYLILISKSVKIEYLIELYEQSENSTGAVSWYFCLNKFKMIGSRCLFIPYFLPQFSNKHYERLFCRMNTIVMSFQFR